MEKIIFYKGVDSTVFQSVTKGCHHFQLTMFAEF